MATVERVTVEFPEPMARQIRAAVESGEYASAGEAVRDAVRSWSDRRNRQDLETERLRQDWDAGKASGRHGALDFDGLRREARARLSARDDRSGRAD